MKVRNGKVSTTDGPFAETKEQLGGFYLIEAKDLNDAIQVAAKIPWARSGAIEVRPVVDFSQSEAGGSTSGAAQTATLRDGDRRPLPNRIPPRPRHPDPPSRRLRSGRGGDAGRVRGGRGALAGGGRPRNPRAGWSPPAASRRSTGSAGGPGSTPRSRSWPSSLGDGITPPVEVDDEGVEDDRLRLIFTCCHPALPPDAQIALTLREVCGLTTEEIARAFLSPAPTLAQRIVRAKSKIKAAKIPYQVPSRADLPERLATVLHVIYLVFNEGYSASSGGSLTRHDLSAEAIRLGRLLVELLPEPEAVGLLALMLLHESRREARTTADGELVLLDGSGSLALESGPDRGRSRPGPAGACARANSGPTPSRLQSPHSTPKRRRRRPPTGRDRGTVRCAAAGRPLSGDRAQPGGGGRHAGWAGGQG